MLVRTEIDADHTAILMCVRSDINIIKYTTFALQMRNIEKFST